MCDGFPGDGWEPLIRRMSEKFEPFCTGTDLHTEQVKEKVRALRVYLNSSAPIPDEVSRRRRRRRTREPTHLRGVRRRRTTAKAQMDKNALRGLRDVRSRVRTAALRRHSRVA